jgi:hypothetical protein
MNVYRYLACGDISILNPERFVWVYSHVHLDEIHRNGNLDALKGIELLRAVEITYILNQEFKSEGNVVLLDYIDPYERYERHLKAIEGYDGLSDFVVENLLHTFGADNFKELSESPEQLRDKIDEITADIGNTKRKELMDKASIVSVEMEKTIEEYLKDKKPIDETRSSLGMTSEIRKGIEKSKFAIDEIWNLISPVLPNIKKDHFFGFEQTEYIEGLQHTQHGAISRAYIILNLLGISPDKGLSKRDKIKNVISDSYHAGMASYCNVLLSVDKGIINKSSCIYSYLNNVTNALSFEFHKGYQLNLSIVENY